VQAKAPTGIQALLLEVLDGEVDRALTARAIGSSLGDLSSCGLHGMVTAKLVIAANGAVTRADVDVADAAVSRCVVSRVRRWKLPPPTRAPAAVTYPSSFM
jgi:hypothetical protein